MSLKQLVGEIKNLSINTNTKESLLSLCASLDIEFEQLRSTTEKDVLGDWPNRLGLFNRAERIFSEYDRGIYPSVCLAFIDLDKFKPINDTYGHKQGDEVIVKVAEIIHSSIRATDVYGRLAGDEFVIVLPGATKKVAEKILERIKQKFSSTIFPFNDKNLPVSLTFGVVSTKDGDENFETLLHEADELMNAQKGDRSR